MISFDDQPVHARLTRRERQILNLLALGKPEKEIGARLGISTRAVKLHRRNIRNKLRAESTVQAVAHGLALGVVQIADAKLARAAIQLIDFRQPSAARESGKLRVNGAMRWNLLAAAGFMTDVFQYSPVW